jgi:pantoate--beta-alanine ligase
VDVARRVLDDAGILPEYLDLRTADDLRPVTTLTGDTLLAVSAHVGAARLIDNRLLRVSA